MGNHEYCVECGESDFHHGRPCDPEKVAEIQANKRKIEEARERNKKALETFKDKLVRKHYLKPNTQVGRRELVITIDDLGPLALE